MGLFSVYRHHLQNSANRRIITTLDPKQPRPKYELSGADKDAKEAAKLQRQIDALPPGHPDIKFLQQSKKIFEDGFYSIAE